MKIISHRGNLNGPNTPSENKIEQIELAIIKNFDVEIDVWHVKGKIFLGHDLPETEISLNYLIKNKNKLWIHCKNIEAAEFFQQKTSESFNFFFHQNDEMTITSKGYFWVYPGIGPLKGSISVLPEKYQNFDYSNCFGICTDFPVTFSKNEK